MQVIKRERACNECRLLRAFCLIYVNNIATSDEIGIRHSLHEKQRRQATKRLMSPVRECVKRIIVADDVRSIMVKKKDIKWSASNSKYLL